MSSTAPQPFDASAAERLAPWAELASRATQCGRLLRSRIATHAAAEGLTETEFLLLWACRDGGSTGKPQGELAAEVGISPAQVSGLVERLQRRELLSGARDPHDRRRQRWQATNGGGVTLARVLARLGSWLAEAERCLDRQRVASLAAGLGELLQALESIVEPVPTLRIVSPAGAPWEATP